MAATLNRTAIIATALVLIDEGGPEALTMRRLADRLGVTATALYYHLPDRQAVLDAVADELCAEIAADVPATGPWTDRLESALLHWHDRTVQYPTAMAWAMTAYAHGEPMLRLHEALLVVLHDAGFDNDAALHVKGALLRFALGHLLIREMKAPKPPPSAVAPEFRRYRAAAAAMKRFDADTHFRLSLRVIIDGFANSPQAPARSATHA